MKRTLIGDTIWLAIIIGVLISAYLLAPIPKTFITIWLLVSIFCVIPIIEIIFIGCKLVRERKVNYETLN